MSNCPDVANLISLILNTPEAFTATAQTLIGPVTAVDICILIGVDVTLIFVPPTNTYTELGTNKYPVFGVISFV